MPTSICSRQAHATCWVHCFGLYQKSTDSETLLFATPSGEAHELGALGAAVLAASLGLGTIYLGPGTPAEKRWRHRRRARVDIVVLGVVGAGDAAYSGSRGAGTGSATATGDRAVVCGAAAERLSRHASGRVRVAVFARCPSNCSCASWSASRRSAWRPFADAGLSVAVEMNASTRRPTGSSGCASSATRVSSTRVSVFCRVASLDVLPAELSANVNHRAGEPRRAKGLCRHIRLVADANARHVGFVHVHPHKDATRLRN